MFDKGYASIVRTRGNDRLVWHNEEAEKAYRFAVVDIRTEAHNLFR